MQTTSVRHTRTLWTAKEFKTVVAVILPLLLSLPVRCHQSLYDGEVLFIGPDGLLGPNIHNQLLHSVLADGVEGEDIREIPDYKQFTCDSLYGEHSLEIFPLTCDSPFCTLCQEKKAMLCCSEVTEDPKAIPGLELLYVSDLDGQVEEQFQNISATIIHVTQCGEPDNTCDIHEGAFLGSDGVRVLRVDHSNLGYLPRLDLFFEGLTSLISLHLDSCMIESWDTFESGASNESLKVGVLPALEVLTLKDNPIEFLPADAFEWLQGSPLKYLSLEGCENIKHVDAGVLLPVSGSLLALELGFSSVGNSDSTSSALWSSVSLRNMLSSQLAELRALGLAGNDLKRVPREALELVRDTLHVLSMHATSLTCFSGLCSSQEGTNSGEEAPLTVFPEMRVLRELSLADSLIEELPRDFLYSLPALHFLSLAGNHFREIGPNTFLRSGELRYLDVSSLDQDEGDSGRSGPNINFMGLRNLQVLDASFTEIRTSPEIFCDTPNLDALFLAGSVVKLDPLGDLQCLENLQYLNISSSLFLCSNFYRHFGDSSRLRELRAASCPFDTFLDPRNVQVLRSLQSLELLDLSGNSFVNLSSLHFVIGLSNLSSLMLDDNHIVLWDDNLLSRNSRLRHLEIGGNSLSSITQTMLGRFAVLRTLDAAHNPFLCYCSMNFFSRFANAITNRSIQCQQSCGRYFIFRRSGFRDCVTACEADEERSSRVQAILDEAGIAYNATDVHLTIVDWDVYGAYECIDRSGTRYMQKFMFGEGECFTSTRDLPIEEFSPGGKPTWLVGVVVGCLSLLVTVGLMLVCCWKWKAIYQFGRAVRSVTLLRLLDDDGEEESKPKRGPPTSQYAYDVFVSYSDPNRQWVLDHLVPNLESSNDLRVCLHERDFQVGLSILENIISCMDESRSILLVLSQAFVRSQWCQFELHLAQHRLLETRREDLILVLLEEIPTSRRPKMLRYLMLTKTYIQWPGDDAHPEHVKTFWRRLRHAVMLPRLAEARDSPA